MDSGRCFAPSYKCQGKLSLKWIPEAVRLEGGVPRAEGKHPFLLSCNMSVDVLGKTADYQPITEPSSCPRPRLSHFSPSFCRRANRDKRMSAARGQMKTRGIWACLVCLLFCHSDTSPWSMERICVHSLSFIFFPSSFFPPILAPCMDFISFTSPFC